MKVGIVGCGFISQNNVKAWRKLGADVVSLCDVNVDAAKALADKMQLWNADTYADWEAMIDAGNLDALSVCTPPASHAAIIHKALQANLKVAVEKPFTVSSKEAAPFQHSLNVTVVHDQVFRTFYLQGLNLLQRSGFLGHIYEVRVSNMTSKTDMMTVNPNHWSHKLQGGRIAETLPHPIYAAQCFSGVDDLTVEECITKKRGSSICPTDELTAVLSSEEADVRAVLNVRLNSPVSVASTVVYGEKGFMQVAIAPQAAATFFYKKESWVYNRIKKRLQKGILFNVPLLHSPRYFIFEGLMQGKPVVTAAHAYHNVRIAEELVARLP